MQKRAGLLFLAKNTGRILLVLHEYKWTLPTFVCNSTIYEDSQSLLNDFSKGKIIPIELYLSDDRGFEYSTYICLVDEEFTHAPEKTLAWCNLDFLPPNLHTGLKNTLTNQIIRAKISTVLELMPLN